MAALQNRSAVELKELLSFWDGHGPDQHTHEQLVGELERRMSSEKAVRKRVKFLRRSWWTC